MTYARDQIQGVGRGTNVVRCSKNAYDHIGGEKSNNGDAIPAMDFEAVLDNMQVVQFTGLHDKNVKEIYEGDVCLHNKQLLQIK